MSAQIEDSNIFGAFGFNCMHMKIHNISTVDLFYLNLYFCLFFTLLHYKLMLFPILHNNDLMRLNYSCTLSMLHYKCMFFGKSYIDIVIWYYELLLIIFSLILYPFHRYELAQAVRESRKREGYIIPIMLRQCTPPDTIEHVTYRECCDGQIAQQHWDELVQQLTEDS